MDTHQALHIRTHEVMGRTTIRLCQVAAFQHSGDVTARMCSSVCTYVLYGIWPRSLARLLA